MEKQTLSPYTEEISRLCGNLQPRAAFGVGEVAKALGVSKFSVIRRIKDGTLKAVPFGRRLLIPASELARLLQG